MLLTINPTTPSLALTIFCGLFVIAIGWFFMRERKPKEKISEPEVRKNCTQSYIAILQDINLCGTTAGLADFFDIADDFYASYQGQMDNKSLLEFYDNILEEINNRRGELLINKYTSFPKSLSTV